MGLCLWLYFANTVVCVVLVIIYAYGCFAKKYIHMRNLSFTAKVGKYGLAITLPIEWILWLYLALHQT